MVCFDMGIEKIKRVRQFDGNPKNLLERKTVELVVSEIYVDLSSGQTDLTTAKVLAENLDKSFRGVEVGGDFYISDEQAELWLNMPNPSGACGMAQFCGRS